MKKITIILSMFATGVLLFSCAKEKNSDVKYESEAFALEAKAPDYSVSAMPGSLGGISKSTLPKINSDKAYLGRVLFYDKKLSLNNTVSCGSCHLQSKGFADDKALSVGFNGERTTRNSMAICNTAFSKGFFWDKRAMAIEDLVLQPVRNHIEMGMESTASLVGKLKKVDYYSELFNRAYGSNEIDAKKVNEALTEFLSSMVSADSKFDQGKKDNFANFTAQEAQGKTIFQQNCNSCHSGSSFNRNTWDQENSESANIGLDENYTDAGIGAFAKGINDNLPNVTTGVVNGNDLTNNGVFKVPSLRNVGLTGPYMHDGRFATLEQVVEHYNSGIQNHPSLDWRLTQNTNQKVAPKRFNWSEAEKASLVAFLKTLTDQKMTTDKKFANPFQ
jgi:cytochrome c peroxidase